MAEELSLFDEPREYGPKPPRSSEGYSRTNGVKYQESQNRPEVLRRYETNLPNPNGGAPPLDWWVIDG